MLPIMDDQKPRASLIIGINSPGEESQTNDEGMLEDAASSIMEAVKRGDKGLLAYALKTFIGLCEDKYEENEEDEEEMDEDYKRSLF